MSVPVEFVNDRGNKVEIKDTEARRLASVAQTAAENAQSTAGGANTLAQQAKDKADTAYTDAGTAQSTATAAGTLAQQAKDIADAATSAASTNAENISTLNGKVTALEGSISDIEEDIETIKEDYISKEELQPYDILEETDNLPLTFTTNGESLIDYKIYGNSNSNHIDEVTNNLPITIPNAKAGIVEDWTIEGNNIPQVENITKELPITFPSNGDNIIDYTIYGNNNPSQPEPEGVLPLSFTTAETVLRDWQIDGNNNPNYVETTSVLPLSFTTRTAENISDWSISGNDKVGKNLLPLTNYSTGGLGNVTYIVDEQSGTVMLNGSTTASGGAQIHIIFEPSETLKVYFSGCLDGGGPGKYDVYCWDVTTNARCKKWDESTPSDSDYGNGSCEATLIAGHTINLNIRLHAGYDANNLTFKPMIRLPDTTSNFEPHQIGVGQKTKNLLEITTGTYTDHGVKFTFDKETGVVVADGKATGAQARYAFYITPTETLNLYLSGCPEGGSSSTYNVYPWDSTAGARPKKWDGTTSQTESDYGTDGLEVQAEAGHKLSVTIRIEEGYTANNVVFKPMYRLSDTSTDFEPFGYKIPLTVNSTTQNIYIGSTPLTAGQSVSKTSIGIDIAAQIGTNTITTDLFNKPEMYVKALDYTGIGEQTKNLLEITAETQTLRGVTFTIDKQAGTVTMDGDTTQQSAGFSFEVMSSYDLDGTFILSGGADGGSASTYDLYMYDAYDQRFSDRLYNSSAECPFTCVSGHKTTVFVQARKNNIYSNIVFKPMLRAADTSADFVLYGYQIPLAVQGKNLLEITATSTTINGVTFTVDKTAGTITANGTASANARFDFCTTEMTVNATDIINGIPDGATSSTYYILAEFENGTNAFGSNLDNTAIGDRPNFTPKVLNWRIYVISGQTVNNLVFKPMIRLADTSTNFVPYFHKDYTFYIGDTPLTEGENISKTSTGVDIETQIGENTISTTLYNKPEMYCGMALGVGMPTKNLLEITADTTTSYDVTFTVDRQAGTVTATGRSSSTSVNTPQFNFNGSDRKPLSNGVVRDGYIFSCPNMIYGAQAGIAYYDENQSYVSEQVCDSTTSSRTISIPSNAVYYRFYLRKNYNAGDTDVIFKPMLRLPDTSTDFEPYGYKVPITITDENSNTTERTFYIGNSRLLSGDTYTKTQAGINIPTTSGNNIIDTTLYNKPEMNVVCNSNVLGVGQKTNDGYILPITVTDSSNNSTNYTFQLGSSPLTEGQSISKTSTGTDIVLLSGTNTISTTMGNKPEMRIDYESAEVGVGIRTVNLYNPNATDVNNGYVNPGRLRIDGTINTSAVSINVWVTEYITVEEDSLYTLVDLLQTSVYGICYYDNNKTYISGETYSGVPNHGNKTITTPTGCKYVRFTAAEDFNTMLVKGSTAPENFIPYGYEIPIRIYDGEANTENTNYTDLNFYIGNSLLSADEYIDFINNKIYKYVSSVLTPTNPIVDLPVIPTNGTNTIDTTLYNKPQMYIKYSTDSFSRIFTTTLPTTFINHSDKVKDWIIYGNENGVGEEGNDGYIIPLVVNGNTINIPIGNAALTEGETVSRTSTNIDIPTIDGENTINTTLTNKPTMKITKDFVTKEYIEDVANSCMNDNVEDIVENVVDEQMSFMFYSPINKNGMFRGKDLTNVYTIDEIYQKVSSGTFDDLYLGDYFTKSITTDIYTKFTGSAFVEGTTYYTRTGTLNNWVYTETEDTSYDSSKTYYTKTTKTENVSLMIAHFNYYYNIGDTAFTNPHIILTNRNYGFATTSKMNPTNTTVGGYYNSEMHQTTLPCYAKSLKTALNNHLLSHKTLLSNAINASTPSMAGAGLTGASSSWAWYDTELQLMTEQQLFGSGIWTSSAYDVGCDGEKLAVFNFVNGVQNGRDYFWLRSVASSTNFAHCGSNGDAYYNSLSYARYVRPLIVFG